MSRVAGIDLSSKAIDIVLLDETEDNVWVWRQVNLTGARSWERTLQIRDEMPSESWWDDVYLVAIEAPYGTGQPGTTAILNRVVGAILACLPSRLLWPHHCWIVRPDEWKSELGIRMSAKPTDEDVRRFLSKDHTRSEQGWSQNARDALCLALYARMVNQRAVELSER